MIEKSRQLIEVTLVCLVALGCSEQKAPNSRDQVESVRSQTSALQTASRQAAGDATATALGRALDDEYKARATYRATIKTLGEVKPFINIVEAEQRHIEALLAAHRTLGLKPPADRWDGKTESKTTLHAACSVAVQAEVDNDALYEELITQVNSTDIQAVMKRLQGATRNRHLPAFRRCLKRAERQ